MSEFWFCQDKRVNMGGRKKQRGKQKGNKQKVMLLPFWEHKGEPTNVLLWSNLTHTMSKYRAPCYRWREHHQQLNAVAIANPAEKFNSPVTHVPSFGILSSLWCMSWRYQITPYCAVYIFLNPSQKALKVHWTQSAPSPICHQLDCPIGVTQH